jgi:U3 small nucleolar RNA-associated protein 18
VRFHPNSQLLFTAGRDKILRLFQIDGINNHKIKSVQFDGFPILCSEFTADGKEIILSGNRNFFYSYDVLSGKATKGNFFRK